MKKIWIIMTGIILALTCFSACSEEVGTPTDVPSAATTVQNQAINQSGDKDVSTPSQEDLQDASTEISNKNSSLEGSSVPSENSTISTVSNVTTPSENTSPQEKNGLEFTQHKQSNNLDGVFWKLPYGAIDETTPLLEKVGSIDALNEILSAYQFSSQATEKITMEYTPEFFKQNRLLLIACSKPETSTCLLVEKMEIIDNELNITIKVTSTHNGGAMVQHVLYPVAVEKELDRFQSVTCKMIYENPINTQERIVTQPLS